MEIRCKPKRVRHQNCAGRTASRLHVEGIEKKPTVDRSPKVDGLLHVTGRVEKRGRHREVHAARSKRPDREASLPQGCEAAKSAKPVLLPHAPNIVPHDLS